MKFSCRSRARYTLTLCSIPFLSRTVVIWSKLNKNSISASKGVIVDKKILLSLFKVFKFPFPYYDVNYLLTRLLMFTHFSLRPMRSQPPLNPLKTIQRLVKIKKLSSLSHRYRYGVKWWMKVNKRRWISNETSARKKRRRQKDLFNFPLSFHRELALWSKKNESWEQ